MCAPHSVYIRYSVYRIGRTYSALALQYYLHDGDNDSARLIHVFHSVVSAVGANVWLECG